MKNKLILIVILLIGFIPLLDLFNAGFPVTHDGQDHIARIANFYQSLSEGNIIPRWAANLNWGYGHPILMFLYPVPSYATSLFHFLGFSYLDSLKIFFGLAFILSGLTMYIWAKNFLGEVAGFFAAVLYLFAPYRFIDLYVRGAIGEHAAFVFPPLIFYFLLRLSKKYSPWYIIGGSLSFAGLILSHNAISLMFLPLILFYVIYLFYSLENKKYPPAILGLARRAGFLLNTLCLLLLGFGLASFFWVPAFMEGKYTLRNIVTAGEYASRFVKFEDLIYGKWNYGISGQFTVQIGILNLLSLLGSVAAIYYLYKRKEKRIILIFGFFIYTLITVFIMLPLSNFIWQKVMILQNFQFPWRFLSVIVFTTSILGALVLNEIPKRFKIAIFLIGIFLSFFLTKDYWKAVEYSQKPESFFTSVYYGTTDTGESAPIWSVRFMEKEPRAHMEIVEGVGEIEELARKSTRHEYKVVADDRIRIRENTLFFPGWKVLVDGKPADIQFQDPKHRGLMTFFVDKGEHLISAQFRETKLRTLANTMSLTSLSIIFFMVLFRKKLWTKYR